MHHYQQEMIMFHLHFSGDIPACSPSIRSRLHWWNLSDLARWLLRLLPHQFRFKNLFFFSFFTMYIMHIFYYTGRWPYYHQHLFPTLSRHLCPAPKYGTNPKDSDRTIRILPMPLLMLYTFLHLTLMKKKSSWMIYCSPIFQSHMPHQHVAAPPPDALPDPSKLSATASTPPKRKQKAKATPKAPANRRRIQGNRLACARDFGSLVHGMAGLACARDAPSFMIFIIIITIITITIIIIIITIIMLINTVMVDVIISIFFIIITIITIIMLINTVIVDVMISIFFFFFIIITIIMLINTVMVDVSKSV